MTRLTPADLDVILELATRLKDTRVTLETQHLQSIVEELIELRRVEQACREWISDNGFECGYLIYDAIERLDRNKGRAP